MRQGHFSSAGFTSTVKNTSGRTMRFGFLPPHGVRLAPDEELTLYGDIRAAISRGDPATDRRYHQAFKDALDRGDLQVTATPSQVLSDPDTGNVHTISVQGGALAISGAPWDESASLDAGVSH